MRWSGLTPRFLRRTWVARVSAQRPNHSGNTHRMFSIATYAAIDTGDADLLVLVSSPGSLGGKEGGVIKEFKFDWT